MDLRLGYEDRGFGRAYVIIESDPSALITASAKDPQGSALPVSIVRAPKAGVWILIAPLMAFDYDIALELRGEDGSVVASEAYPLRVAGPVGPKAPSSQLLASGLDDIRNVDRNPTPSAVWISPTKAIDFDDGTDVVHADVVARLPEGEEPGEPELTLIDLEGNHFEIAPAIVLDHERRPEGEGFALHRLQLSFRVPRELNAFVMGVRWGSRAGFSVAEPWLLGKLRGEWWDITHKDSNKGDYHHWFLENGRESDRALVLQSRTPQEDGPVFSIVVPIFETPLDFLADMLRSVVAQTYARWELLLVNASPQNAPLARALAEAEAADARIRVLPLEGNRGIALNTRVGIGAASGEYVCFFDHDDVLEPNALFEYARAIREDPEIALLYCDEDLLIDGTYHSGYFKPDFNLDLLLNQNYVTHLLCVSRKMLEELRGGRGIPGKEFDGAQDFALTLFVAATGAKIHHVRRFLYHWRAHAGSTSISHSAKTWTDDAGRRALEAFLSGEGLRAHVEPGVEQNIYRVRYDVPEGARVSAIVRRTTPDERVYDCLDSLLEEAGELLEDVAVVNPFAKEHAPLDLARYAGVPVREVRVGERVGVGAERNLGAEGARGTHLLFLDDRATTRKPGWLGELLGPHQRADVAVTGAGLVYEDGLIRHVGICLPLGAPRYVNALVPFHSEDADYYRRMPKFTRGVSAVSATALLVEARAFRAQGGFDEGFLFGLDDVDLCLRLREAGRSVVAVPRAELTYHGRAENGRVLPFSYRGQPASPATFDACERVRHDEGLFRTRWSRYWGFGDPLYNPQLARDACHYQLEWD